MRRGRRCDGTSVGLPELAGGYRVRRNVLIRYITTGKTVCILLLWCVKSPRAARRTEKIEKNSRAIYYQFPAASISRD